MLKTKAIVISKQDSGDKDVIITLFSLENGLLRVKLKSVKNGNSKMKFAKELFLFGEFILAENNGYYTVTSCENIDSFYEIVENYERYTEAIQIFKILKSVLVENQTNVKLFLTTLKSLKMLTYFDVQENIVCCKFLLELFLEQGYLSNVEKCSNCNGTLSKERFLNLNTGEIMCGFCQHIDCIKINYAETKVIEILLKTDIERLHTVKLNDTVLSNTLNILLRNFERRFLF